MRYSVPFARRPKLSLIVLLLALLLSACGGAAATPPTAPAPAARGPPRLRPRQLLHPPAAREPPPPRLRPRHQLRHRQPEATATAAPAPTATAARCRPPKPTLVPLPPPAEGTFTYWGGLIFSDDANKMLEARIKKWGEEKGIKVDVVMINQNETTQRVSAAIEAGTMPDALDMGRDLMLLLSQTGKLEALDDVYDAVGKAHGGWLKSADSANDPKDFGGKRYGIPFGTSGNLLNRRSDVLEAAGYKDPPKTWQELGEMALKAQKPPETYGMGFALSNVGDGNLTTAMLQSWGGRIADDAGKTCTIDSQPTRDFLTWITDLFKKGAFPPGVVTWDGAGDNTAYQSGNALFIANPGSVYSEPQDQRPRAGDRHQVLGAAGRPEDAGRAARPEPARYPSHQPLQGRGQGSDGLPVRR